MRLAALSYPLLRPLLHALDAEAAHRCTLQLLKLLPTGRTPPADSRLSVKAFGLDFPNPLGLAAGFDKNAEAPGAMLGLGLGFVEVGSVTPKPQAGNPKPRLFRLPKDEAVINRMGFNNDGHARVLARLQRRPKAGLIGINIGANKESPDRIADYCAGIACFSSIADYLSVNISSPNTPGLRALQGRAELSSLLARLDETRARELESPPLLLKIAPDLSERELEDVAACVMAAKIDGVIISNTTVSRPPLRSPHAKEEGGLSGRPLFALSTRQLARFHQLTEGRIPLVGVGGISDAEGAWLKIAAGASLLQLYTALVFKGPALIGDILEGLAARLAREKLTLAELCGREAEAIAHHGLEGR